MYLSIVIPVYNEKIKIINDIKLVSNFFSNSDIEGEIIVVDDGSSDGTCEILERLQKLSSFKLIRHQKNQGKGSAVRTGMMASQGDYVMFVDSGHCVPYQCAIDGLKLLTSNQCDLAFGSRKLPGSTIVNPQSIYRRLFSKVFNIFIINLMNVPSVFTDAQCGFKIFKGDIARKLFSACKTSGFTFDIEILLRALKQGYRISEFPVKWSNDSDSRVHPIRMIFIIFKELIKTKKLLSTLG